MLITIHFLLKLKNCSRRGIGLVDAGLGSMILIGFMAMKIDQTRQEQVRLNIQSEARIITKLADAAFEFVFGQPANYAVGTATEIKTTDLMAAGVLGTETSLISSSGATFSTHVFRKTPQEFVILARSNNPATTANLNRWPIAGTGINMVGLVHESNPNLINGPSLSYKLDWMDNKFSNFKPKIGDMVAVSVLRSNMHLDEYLHRVSTPLTPNLNTMTTDLKLAGNNITGVGDIIANSIEIADTLSSSKLEGATQFLGSVSTNTLSVTGNASITGATAISGKLTATSAEIKEDFDVKKLQAGGVIITGGSLIVDDVTVNNKISTDLIASKNGIFETISVTSGGCTGC